MNAMPRSFHENRPAKRTSPRFPAVPFYAALGLLAVSVSATIFGTVTGIGTVRDTFGKPVAIRDITISGTVNEPIEVRDVQTGDTLAAFAEGEGGFVRGSLRALSRMRLVSAVEDTTPYRIIRWENGAISLSDTGSGERIYLNAFGPDNAAAFAALLDGKSTQNTKAALSGAKAQRSEP